MIASQLDDLVTSGRISGYTIEEDARYLTSERPTLTYRMYTRGADSHLNLGAFAAAMAELPSNMRLSRVEGVLGIGGRVGRSPQLCLTAEFPTSELLVRALDVVRVQFTAAAAAIPGSWRFPDVRVVGATSPSTTSVYAHEWPHGGASVVLLALTPMPPVTGARTHRVQVLHSWLSLLGRQAEAVLAADHAWLALSA